MFKKIIKKIRWFLFYNFGIGRYSSPSFMFMLTKKEIREIDRIREEVLKSEDFKNFEKELREAWNENKEG